MSGVTGPGPKVGALGAAAPAKPPTAKETALKKSTGQMEGMFVQQLYKAMRATVPEDTEFGGGSGEEMFTGLMDEHLAAETPREWRHGLGEALYTQLRGALGPKDTSAAPTTGSAPAPVAALAPAAGASAPAGDDGR